MGDYVVVLERELYCGLAKEGVLNLKCKLLLRKVFVVDSKGR